MRTRCGFAGYIPGERDGVGTETAEAGAPQ
jgi:hypothetical protein